MIREFRKWILSIIYILMSIQIGFGVAWIFANMGALPRFRESADLFIMSQRLRADEYTGFLYLVCVRLLVNNRAVGLYVLQLVLAFGAYVTLLEKLGVVGRRKCAFFAGFLLTIPVVLQVHMAVLPYSMAGSVFLLLLADVIPVLRKKEKPSVKRFLRWGALWILSSQLSPEYGWFGAIVTGIVLVSVGLRQKQFRARAMVCYLCVLLSVGGLNALLQKPGEMGRIHKSVASDLLLLVVWPDFSTLQFFWDAQITDVLDEDELTGISYFPEKVIYAFGPTIESAYGTQKAEELYLQMVKTAFRVNTREVVSRIGEDVAAGLCPPLTVAVQLQGAGSSYTGWNYGRMKDVSPVLTKYYVQFATNVWFLMGVGCIVPVVDWFRKKDRSREKDSKGIQLLFPATILMMDLCYVIQGGHMQDYLKLVVNSVLWGCWMLMLLEKNIAEDE